MFLSISLSCIKPQVVPASLMTVMSPQPPVMKSQNSQHPRGPSRSQSPENQVFAPILICLKTLCGEVLSGVLTSPLFIIHSFFYFACSWTLCLATAIDIPVCLIQFFYFAFWIIFLPSHQLYIKLGLYLLSVYLTMTLAEEPGS